MCVYSRERLTFTSSLHIYLSIHTTQVKYYSRRLFDLLKADGLQATEESEAEYQVAQYDAIFSIGTRRNEVWAVLKKHDWQ